MDFHYSGSGDITYTIIDKIGMVAFSRVEEIRSDPLAPLYFLLENSICYLVFGLYLYIRGELKVGSVWKKEWHLSSLTAIGTMASYSLILHVMKTETVSYIVTLCQSSILIAVLTGWRALKEPYGKYRLIIVCYMMVGFFFVATG